MFISDNPGARPLDENTENQDPSDEGGPIGEAETKHRRRRSRSHGSGRRTKWGEVLGIGFGLVGVLLIGFFFLGIEKNDPDKITPSAPSRDAIEKAVRELLELELNSRKFQPDVFVASPLRDINVWSLRGNLKTTNSSGARQLFFARAKAVCGEWDDIACWKISALTVDGKPLEIKDTTGPDGVAMNAGSLADSAPDEKSGEGLPSGSLENNTLKSPGKSGPKVGSGRWRTISDRVNARKGPGEDFETFFRMPKQVPLTLIKKDKDWGEFEYAGKDGTLGRVWIAMKVVEPIDQTVTRGASGLGSKKRIVRRLSSKETITYGARTLSYVKGALAQPIGMQLVRGVHPVVRVRVNGNRELNLLVDTGATRTVVPSGLFGENTGAKTVHLKSLCFENGVCFEGVAANSRTSNYSQDRPGYYNGLLGVDLLRRTGLTLDYKNRRIYLGLKAPKTLSANAHRVIFSMDETARPHTTMTVATTIFPKILLDTGSSFTRMTPAMLNTLGITPTVAYREMAFAVSRIDLTEISTLPAVCLDGTACVPSILGQKANWPAVGGTFFRNFLTTFNFKKNSLTLRPYGPSWKPPRSALQRLGLQLHILDASQIVWIEPGTAAEKAGLSSDMTLKKINGHSVETLGYLGVHGILEDPETRRFEISATRDDGVSRIVRLEAQGPK